MIENILKSFAKSILSTVSAKYDIEIAAMKADIAAMKAASTTSNTTSSTPEMPLYPPSDTTHPAITDTPIPEPARPANILFRTIEDSMGNYPVGSINGHRYDFEMQFEPSPGLQVLRFINNFSVGMNFSNLEVAGEGNVFINVVQRMYDATDPSVVLFVHKEQYASLIITKSNTEYMAVNFKGVMTPNMMYDLMVMHTPTLNTNS